MSETPKTDAAMIQIERMYTKSDKNVTTRYKAAFYSLGRHTKDLERELNNSAIKTWPDFLKSGFSMLTQNQRVELIRSLKGLYCFNCGIMQDGVSCPCDNDE